MAKNLLAIFSVNEGRTSALIICLFVLAGFTCFKYLETGLIGANMRDILETLIYVIGGINILGNRVAKGLDKAGEAYDKRISEKSTPEPVKGSDKVQ